MVEVVLVLKIFLFGILGHYIMRFIDKKKYIPGSFYSLYYALFSIGSLVNSSGNVIYLFLVGIFWASLLKVFLNSVDKKLTPNVNNVVFGLLNIINFYFLNPLLNAMVAKSATSSVIILFILGAFVYFLDLSLELRRTN